MNKAEEARRTGNALKEWDAAKTLGPWRAQPTAGHDKHGQSVVYHEASGKDIAIVYDGDKHAALIAAAPELLFQLRLANDNLGLLHSDDCREGLAYCDCALATNWRHNREAMAKAEGKL